MAKLLYISNVSLDGSIEDEHGSFDWTGPEDDVFAFITDFVRSVGPTFTGVACTTRWRAVWETNRALAVQSELMGNS